MTDGNFASTVRKIINAHEHVLEYHQTGLPRSHYRCTEVWLLFLDAKSSLGNGDEKAKELLENFYRACKKSEKSEDCERASKKLNKLVDYLKI